jgi:glyoxylase-like metal-dependent hydrolase (beta-lactamase superfamily II)
VLLTHHHYDHVSELEEIRERWPGIAILVSPKELAATAEQSGIGDLQELDAGETREIAGLTVRTHAIPGHTAGMLAIEVVHPDGGPSNVFTGDTLFKGSVGGVRAPGSTSYADLKHSIMEVLMKLPPDTVLRPGHIEETTVGDEWAGNGFILRWRGIEPESAEQCTALGEPATLVYLGDDYDGGHKAWVRWPDGRDDIVPGSQVKTGA